MEVDVIDRRDDPFGNMKYRPEVFDGYNLMGWCRHVRLSVVSPAAGLKSDQFDR